MPFMTARRPCADFVAVLAAVAVLGPALYHDAHLPEVFTKRCNHLHERAEPE